MHCAEKSGFGSLYRIVFSTIACFAFIFLFDLFAYIGPLLPSYAALKSIQVTSDIRAINEIWFPVCELMLAISITAFYFCWRFKSNDSPNMQRRIARYRDGLGFGGFIGLFMGISMMSLYVALDLPGISPLLWALTGLLKGLFLGLILTALHPKPIASIA